MNSRLIVTIINNCNECEHKGRQVTATEFIHDCLATPDIENDSGPRVIIKYDRSVDQRKVRVEIPDWCPLEVYGPKFEDV